MKDKTDNSGFSEEAIAAKVRAGLDRGQAIEVLQRQAEHDTKQAAENAVEEKPDGKGKKTKTVG